MKTLKRLAKYVASLLSVLILFQSCKVYQHHPSSLEEAVKEEKRVKIKMNDGSILKFKKVELFEGEFYGVSKIQRELVKVPIEGRNIEKVRLQNKTMSTVYTIGIGIVTLGIVGVIAVFEAIDDIPIY